MTLKNFDFKQSLAFGEEGEHEIAEILLKKGVVIMPLYQFDTTKDAMSPKIITMDGEIIAPDLTCFNNGKAFFIEVKTKTRWVNFKNGLETGLNKSHFNEYKIVKEYTFKEVWICFNHKEKKPIGKFICEIDTPHREWDGLNERNGIRIEQPMVFYKITDLKQIKNG